MKLNLIPNKKDRIPHKPLSSFKELAASVGMTVPQLRGAFHADDTAPKPIRKAPNVSYYDPTEFRKWWDRRVAK